MIYHVARKGDWMQCADAAEYSPPAFAKERFIHACTIQQLDGVLKRYFRSESGLLLLHIDERQLGDMVRMEESTDRELFPHIYGPIPKTSIASIEEIR